jgi:uncharacterized protein (TIGR02001 family)
MKKKLLATLPFIAAATIATPASAEISANIAATSNYIWRGVTQTGDQAAVQGGVDYAHEKGGYAGIWTSNISGGHEVDLYFGYTGSANDLEYDLGYIYYAYPSAGNGESNFSEVSLSTGYGMFSASLAYTVAAGDDISNDTGDLYLNVGINGDLENDWTWAASIGRYEFDADGSAAAGDISYTHYQFDLGKSVGTFGDFTLSLSGAEIESGSNDPKAFVTWAKGF